MKNLCQLNGEKYFLNYLHYSEKTLNFVSITRLIQIDKDCVNVHVCTIV